MATYPVTLSLPIADAPLYPSWDDFQAFVDNKIREATDAKDQDAVKAWNGVHDDISRQLP